MINQAKNQSTQKSQNTTTVDSVSISGNLSIGMKGTAVSDLQSALTKLGYNTQGIDGDFGQNTKNAVIAFQRAHGLQQDGIVGTNTKGAIAASISNKSAPTDAFDTIVGSPWTSGAISAIDRVVSMGVDTALNVFKDQGNK